jgi:L-asparaginase
MIVVLGTGGTIAGTSSGHIAAGGYTAAQVGIEKLLGSVPGLDAGSFQCEQVMQVDSKDMTYAGWRSLALAVARHLERGEVSGIVVTHGTDTLEETVYFLHRLLAPGKPVVFAAAMRPATAVLADGPQCLLDAVQLAGNPKAPGVVAVVAGSVFHPEGVRKWHSYRLDAFSGGDAGPIGWVENGYVRRFREWPGGTPLGLHLMDIEPEDWPRVEIVLNHVGADGLLIDLLIEKGVDGIVVAGTGNGTVSVGMEQAIARAEAAGLQVRLSTRCAAGRVARDACAERELTAVQTRVELILELLALRAAALPKRASAGQARAQSTMRPARATSAC